MLPLSKKRKLTETALGPSITPARGIRAFGKITKPGLNLQELGKSKLNGGNSIANLDDPSSGIDVHHKKRKLRNSQECLLKQALDSNGPASVQSPCQSDQDPISRRPLQSSSPPLALFPVQQATPRRKRALRSNLLETPTKGARSCLGSFALSSPPVSESNSSVLSTSSQTPPSSPASIKDFPRRRAHDENQNLPDELQDLIHLHSSFLNALSLHYAHNGSFIPADLRLLQSGIERSWRKRKVSSDDVRRILSIAQSPEAADSSAKKTEGGGILSLSDYGRGKICVEIEVHSKHQGLQRSPLDEEARKKIFTANLEMQWKRYVTNNSPSPSTLAFISLLPLLPITPCPSISKISPLLSKGQRRLEDLKAGPVKAQLLSQLRSTSVLPTSAISPTTNTRNDSLLSRIRAKQLHQSTLPSPPSAATIQRKSALHRLEEIAPVIELLTLSTGRSPSSRPSDATCSTGQMRERGTYSCTMSTLVQNLQMSLKNPIAKEDAVRCVKLLAKEVAPRWVRIKEVGKVVGVTVWKGESVGRLELARRVQDMLARC